MYTIIVRTSSQLRNITLSAPSARIDDARRIAQARGQTLNEAFRKWLEEFTASSTPISFEDFVDSIGPVDLGPIPNREARNARS